MTGAELAQMMDTGDHMDGWGWGWGIMMMVLLVVIIGLVAWVVVRATQQPSSGHPHDRAREILAERLAKGEITSDEFRDLAQHLR